MPTQSPDQTSEPEVVANAVWLPCRSKQPRRPAVGGVRRADGSFVEASLLLRHYFKSVDDIRDTKTLRQDKDVRTEVIVGVGQAGANQATLAGTHIFGGYFFDHYGHFLLETLSRLWFIKANPTFPVAWMKFDSAEEQQWHLDLLASLGVENPVLWLDEQTEFEKLIVPEPGYIIASRFWPEQASAMALAPETDMQSGKKVWLSRTRLKKGVTINENLVEQALQAAGWTIYHPQDDAVPDQVAMLADAEHIAGIEGSAFHTLILMPYFKGQVTIISRVAEMDFDLIARTNQTELTRVKPSTAHLPRYHNSWGNEFVSWWFNVDEILEAIGEKRSDEVESSAPLRLGNITKSLLSYYKASSFIELFAGANTVASDVVCRNRVSVSDGAQYNVPKSVALGVKQFDIAPDVFFASGI